MTTSAELVDLEAGTPGPIPVHPPVPLVPVMSRRFTEPLAVSAIPLAPPIDHDAMIAQGRIIDAVVDDSMLLGTVDELAAWLAVRPDVFRAALEDLVRAQWVFMHAAANGRLTVGWERREHDLPVATDRRGPGAG